MTALAMYPVKSCAGTPLGVARLDRRGIRHDREFMLVDDQHRCLTQREQPRLALVTPLRTDSTLTLTAPGMSELTIEPRDTERYPVTIWDDRVVAADQGAAVAGWFSSYLGTACRLVRLPEDTERRIDPAYATRPDDQVSLADAFPVLLVAEESLADLNRRVAEPLPMPRFRPNVVVSGAGLPYSEDTWATIRIGAVVFSVVKACARCAITTTDQVTAQRGPEPLATLATYRRVPRGVLFGQNLIHAHAGQVAVGDGVHVMRTAPPPAFLAS